MAYTLWSTDPMYTTPFATAGEETTVYRVTTGTQWLRELVRLPGSVRDAIACGPRILFTLGTERVLVDSRDGTAVTDRAVLAILENFQGEVPEVLCAFGAPERVTA